MTIFPTSSIFHFFLVNFKLNFLFKIKLGQRFVTGKDAFSAGVEHIGEAVPVLPDGSCANPDLYNTGEPLKNLKKDISETSLIPE